MIKAFQNRVFVFAPGAGAPSNHPWMTAWSRKLGRLGSVVTIYYPYQMRGSRRPDPLPVLVAAHRAAVAKARRDNRSQIVLTGKSMGGRVGCHVALEEEVSALICFGYPLCGAGDRQ